MGNHGYITLEKKIVINDLENMLKVIVEERFQCKLYIEVDDDYVAVMIKDKAGEENHVTSFFLGDGHGFPMDGKTGSNEIEFNHTSGDPFWWIELILTDQLAYRFKGMISDDGVDGKWEPNIDKYPTYRNWAERWHRRHLDAKPHWIQIKVVSWLERRYVNKMIKELVETYGDIFADAPKEGAGFGATGVLVE
jgi:Arc/MetJ family transcription regulator